MRRWVVTVNDKASGIWVHLVVGRTFPEALEQARMWWQQCEMDWDDITNIHFIAEIV